MVPWRSFSVLWDKKKWQNPENFPLPGLKIFDTRNLWKHRMVLLRFYRYSETIFSNGVQWYPLLMHKFLRYTKLSEKTKSSPTSFFGPVWQKVFDGKRWYPPVWCTNLSVPESFGYTEVFTNEIFRYSRTQSFRQNREASPLLCLKKFDTRILLKHRRVLLRKLSALWGEVFSTKFSAIRFLCV